MVGFFVAVLCFLSACLIFYVYKSRKLFKEVESLKIFMEQVSYDKEQHLSDFKDLQETRTVLKSIKSKAKSTEVRTGFIIEKVAPFLEVFKHNPENAHHLGNPIDYVIFNEDEIVFLEVKSGKSRITRKQNNIKKLIEEGKVNFELIRIDYE